MIQITDSDTELTKNGLVLIDFYAEWCKPCTLLSPVLEKLSGVHKNVTFYKVDIDNNHAITSAFAVSALPTVIILKDGVIVKKFVGLTKEKDISNSLNNL